MFKEELCYIGGGGQIFRLPILLFLIQLFFNA